MTAVLPVETAVRDAVPADAAGIATLLGGGSAATRELGREDRRVLVVGARDDIAGVAVVWDAPDARHLLDLAVAMQHRRRGVATRLLDALCVPGRRVTLEVRAGNVAARRLYARVGFVETGLRPGYYPAVRAHPSSPALGADDAVIAWWPDTPDDVPLRKVPPC